MRIQDLIRAGVRAGVRRTVLENISTPDHVF